MNTKVRRYLFTIAVSPGLGWQFVRGSVMLAEAAVARAPEGDAFGKHRRNGSDEHGVSWHPYHVVCLMDDVQQWAF